MRSIERHRRIGPLSVPNLERETALGLGDLVRRISVELCPLTFLQLWTSNQADAAVAPIPSLAQPIAIFRR